jgi:hypothetical protein
MHFRLTSTSGAPKVLGVMARKQSDQIKSFSLRLPTWLLEHVKQAGEARGMSANTEMVDRLAQGAMADVMFRGVLSVRHLSWLTDWAEMIAEGCRRCYVDADMWPLYAYVVPFAPDLVADDVYEKIRVQALQDVGNALKVLGGPRSKATLDRKVRAAKTDEERNAAALLGMISDNKLKSPPGS